MHQPLFQKVALKATIHSPSFSGVVHKTRVVQTNQDVEYKVFWKDIYYLLRAEFQALKALWYSDTIYPAIDKISYLSKRANDTILWSASDFDDFDLFWSMMDLQWLELIWEQVNSMESK